MLESDIPFAIRLTDQENWGVTRSALQRLIRLNPSGCLVAYDGATRLGITTTTSYGKKLAWIGNVIVDKAHRGKHVGQSLVAHALATLQKSNISHVALYCYKEHRRFYENLGFNADRPFIRLRRNSKRTKLPKNATDFQKPPPLTRIVMADRKAFGADRSKLIRDLLRKNEAWYIASTGGRSRICYLMVKEYAEDCEIGPWICINPTREEPTAMLNHALARIRAVPVEAYCLSSNRKALRAFKANDFMKVREGYRMLYGESIQIGDDMSQYALGFLDKG